MPSLPSLCPPRSVNGDVRFFDPRMPESVNVLQIVKGLTALDIHPQADLIAWWVPCGATVGGGAVLWPRPWGLAPAVPADPTP